MKIAAEHDKTVIGDELYDSRELFNFYNMVTHAERRTPRDMLQRTLMTTFLLRGLTQSGYFGEKTTFGAELSADQASVGAAMLKGLQIMQFNSHEVSELVSHDPNKGNLQFSTLELKI